MTNYISFEHLRKTMTFNIPNFSLFHSALKGLHFVRSNWYCICDETVRIRGKDGCAINSVLEYCCRGTGCSCHVQGTRHTRLFVECDTLQIHYLIVSA